MATPEKAICMLFLQEIRADAQEIGGHLSMKGVKSLREKPCLDAFLNEWTMARLAWIEVRADRMTNHHLRQAVKHMIVEAVNTYDGSGKTRFVDYSILALTEDEEDDQSRPKMPGSLFLSGYGERLEHIPPKSWLSPRKKLTPHEQVEIMVVVNDSCWSPGLDLESTLEALRLKLTPELISLA